jgi:hypothetical protein
MIFLYYSNSNQNLELKYILGHLVLDKQNPQISINLVKIDWLIDWCLVPTLEVFELYRGIS